MTTILSKNTRRTRHESGVSRDLSLRESAQESGRWSSQPSSYREYPRRSSVTAPDWAGRTTTLTVPSRTRVAPRPSLGRRLVGSRLGSQQQVSQRGRRLSVRATTEFPKLSGVILTLLFASVVVAVGLSGLVTSKTFEIKALANQEASLTREVETLHRDVQNLQSTAGIVQRAGKMGMVVPAQPGVLSVSQDGKVEQSLEATADTRPIIDVNAIDSGASVTTGTSRARTAPAARAEEPTPVKEEVSVETSQPGGAAVQQDSPVEEPVPARQNSPAELNLTVEEDSLSRETEAGQAVEEQESTGRQTRQERIAPPNRINAVPYQSSHE